MTRPAYNLIPTLRPRCEAHGRALANSSGELPRRRTWHLSCEAYRDEQPDLWRWIASPR